jgi:hypothetical protein
MENGNVKITISKFFLAIAFLLILITNPLTVKYLISQKGTLGNSVTFSLLAFNLVCASYILITIFAVSSFKKGKIKFLNNLLNVSLLFFFITIILLMVEVSFRTVFKSFLHFRPFEYSEFFGVEWIKPNLDIVSESSEYKATFKTNKYGFRSGFDFSPKKNNEIRIINIGDSYIMAGETDFENTMSCKLENYLNENGKDKYYRVINAGKSGLSQKSYKIFLQRNLKLFDADYLIMYIYVGNDIEDEMTEVKYAEENRNLFKSMINSSYILLTRYSNFIKYIDERLISKIHINHPPEGVCQPFDNEPPEISKNVFMKKYNEKINDGFNNLFNNTLEIAKTCRENNVKFLVGVIPSKEQAQSENLNRLVNFYKIDTATLDMRKPQNLISDFLNKNQIVNIDLLDTMKEASKSAKTYLDIDSHWTIFGNEIAARKINVFLKNYIFKN